MTPQLYHYLVADFKTCCFLSHFNEFYIHLNTFTIEKIHTNIVF